jgi:hypothetical protein
MHAVHRCGRSATIRKGPYSLARCINTCDCKEGQDVLHILTVRNKTAHVVMESLLFPKVNSNASDDREADDHHQASYVCGKNILCFHNGANMDIELIFSHNR